MATEVIETETVTLQDGTVVEVKPLNIKKLRKFMEVAKKFNDENDEEQNLDLMVDAVAIALETAAPELVKDRDKLEDVLDVPTIWKVLEVAGGITRPDPNLLAAMGQA